MAKTITGLELADLLREKIDMRDDVVAAPPFSRTGKRWYRESLDLLRSVRADLAERFSHVAFSRDSVHVEPAWKQPGHPLFEEVKQYFVLGTTHCADLLATAIRQIDENRQYTIAKDSEVDDPGATRWYRQPAYLAAIATVVAAVFAMIGAIGSAYVNQPKTNNLNFTTIVNLGDKEVREGYTADVFQTKDFIFVAVPDKTRPRARLITSGFYAPQLGDDFSFSEEETREYPFQHGGQQFTLALKGPFMKDESFVILVRVTRH
jgi:hypothetical protein